MAEGARPRKSFTDHLRDVVQKARDMRLVARPESVDREAIIESLQKRIGYGSLMESLNGSPAFQAFQGAFRKRRDEIIRSMRDTEIPDGVARNMIRLQAQLEECDAQLEYCANAIEDGKAAQAQWDELVKVLKQESEEDNG